MHKQHFCRDCEMQIRDVCSHLACKQANARGFCSVSCEQRFYANMKPQVSNYGRVSNG